MQQYIKPLHVLRHLPPLLRRPTLLPALRGELATLEAFVERGGYAPGEEAELEADVAEVLADIAAAWPPEAIEAARAAA